MRDRVDLVENAHTSTFRWIFGDTQNDDASDRFRDTLGIGLFDERARAKVDSFVQWLSSGTGVYHIAGKLGSGKSTLIKYLSGHNRVREELQKWAGEFRSGHP
jgi:putative ribosome biogenesis GTPase RsgA